MNENRPQVVSEEEIRLRKNWQKFGDGRGMPQSFVNGRSDEDVAKLADFIEQHPIKVKFFILKARLISVLRDTANKFKDQCLNGRERT